MKATYTEWCCIVGPAELVEYLVDDDHTTELSYADFAAAVDVSTAPLDATQFEVLPTDWAVSWLATYLPSGTRAWVMVHSGIEYLFTVGGDFDHANESAQAAAWEDAQ
jgi:hypothetical protein